MGTGRWRPLAVAVLSVVCVGGLAVSLAWPEADSDPDPRPRAEGAAAGAAGPGVPAQATSLAGWDDTRWPTRGDLVDHGGARSGVEAAIQEEYADDATHLLWVGTRPGPDGGERSTAYVVVPADTADTADTADAVTVVELRAGTSGEWSVAPSAPTVADGSAPAVRLPAAQGVPPAYLAAADVTGVAAIALGPEGVVAIPVSAKDTSAKDTADAEDPTDGLTTVDPASVPPPSGCAAPLLRYDRPDGSDYVPPWGGPGLLTLAAEADQSGAPRPPAGPDLLASLVAGVCAGGLGTPTELSWPVGEFSALAQFPDPSGSAAIARLTLTTPEGAPAATLAYVPAGGTAPATLGQPRPPRDPAAGAELAVVAESDGAPVVLAAGVTAPPTTVPNLPVMASGPGLAVLGPLPGPDAPVALVYAGADGQPAGTDLIR